MSFVAMQGMNVSFSKRQKFFVKSNFKYHEDKICFFTGSCDVLHLPNAGAVSCGFGSIQL